MEDYRIRDFQILGGPNWINDDQWHIEAKAAPDVILTWTESENPYLAGPLARMLQSLIEASNFIGKRNNSRFTK
jgi:uncharacterized protein (TIGR03435 family)